jgi:hypothetical protein
MAGAPGNAIGITLGTDKLGRTSIKGLHETRRALMSMGMERNEFEKLIKQSAIIGAREATRIAPVVSGRLAMSIRGQASRKYTSQGVSKRAYGGVIVGTKDYARAVSYGHYFEEGKKSVQGNRTWRKTSRTRGNSFMVKGREKAKPEIVRFWRVRIALWTRKNGFETNGF